MAPHRRRGSLYIAVLGCSIVVAAVGLMALTAARVERRFAQGSADFADARFYAQSAVEVGMHRIRNDSNWRTTNPNGTWISHQPLGRGTYSLQGVDPDDGMLADSDMEPVVLTGIGYRGTAQYRLQVTLVAEVRPVSCLEVSLHAGNDLIFNGSTVNGAQKISANDSVGASTSTINPNVEAVNAITGGTYNGATTSGVRARSMPDANKAFDYYVTNGTPIAYLALPRAGSASAVERVVLSPANNPFAPGVTNPQGIYVIDCAGGDLFIRNGRIMGTLLLKNCGSSSAVESSVHWEPAVANYPALLVSGSVKLAYTNVPLSESATGTNFNPEGTPYQGASDSILDDAYPSVIKGLIYVSNDVTTANYIAMNGVIVVGNTLTAGSTGPTGTTFDLTYRQTFLDNPPPGFTEPPRMIVSQASWRRRVD